MSLMLLLLLAYYSFSCCMAATMSLGSRRETSSTDRLK